LTTLTNFVKRHEGFRLVPYQCTAGKWTWGYGRNIEDMPLNGEEALLILRAANIDSHSEREQALKHAAEKCLENNIEYATSACQMIFDDFNRFTVNRQIALVSVMFNIGYRKFLEFKRMIAAIRRNAWDRAAIELKDSKRHKQIPMRSDEEADMLRVG